MRNNKFTLIEIIITLTIFTISIVGVLTLLSSSLSLSNNAKGKNYAVISSNIFIESTRSWILYKTYDDDGNVVDDYWQGLIQEKAEFIPSHIDIIPVKNNLLIDEGLTDNWVEKDAPEATNFKNLTILPIKSKSGIYRILLKTNDFVDFDGVCRIWKSPIEMSFWNGSTNTKIDNSYDTMCRLNIEITWPITKPYAERFLKIYSYDIERNN